MESTEYFCFFVQRQFMNRLEIIRKLVASNSTIGCKQMKDWLQVTSQLVATNFGIGRDQLKD